MIDAFSYEGPAQGPKVLVLGGVHGDEVPGIRACDQLIGLLNSQKLHLQAGQLLVIPRVNAAAVAQNKRYIDENLNRIVMPFTAPETHEQKLANALIPYLDAADVVLDIHGTTAPTAPFVFLDDESPDTQIWAAALGLDYMLAGWPALYEKTGEVSTTEYVLRKGRRALTIEAGQLADTKAAEVGLRAALHTLGVFGLLPPPPPVKKPRHLKLTHVILREQEGWLVEKWKNFDYVKAGTVIARYDDGTALTCDHNGYVIMPKADAKRGEEWFYLATALDAPGAKKA